MQPALATLYNLSNQATHEAVHLLCRMLVFDPVSLRTFKNIFCMQTGLEIATDTVANATNIFSLATKNSVLVAKVVTRFLYILDLN